MSMHPETPRPGVRRIAGAALIRALLLAVLWWVLIEGRTDYLHYGLFAVPAAAALSVAVFPPRAGARGPSGGTELSLVHRMRAIVVLIGWLLGRAVSGGIDVARRTVSPGAGGATAPGFLEAESRLEGTARAAGVLIFNLMPGALVAQDRGDRVVLHAVDLDMPVRESWHELESRIAAAAGQRLPASPDDDS